MKSNPSGVMLRIQNGRLAKPSRARSAGRARWAFIESRSGVERAFAEALDKNDAVKFFLKLPKWFKADTPLGTYNPDWAILLKEDTEKLYLVNETKASPDEDDLRNKEVKKIAYGRKHHNALLLIPSAPTFPRPYRDQSEEPPEGGSCHFQPKHCD